MIKSRSINSQKCVENIRGKNIAYHLKTVTIVKINKNWNHCLTN